MLVYTNGNIISVYFLFELCNNWIVGFFTRIVIGLFCQQFDHLFLGFYVWKAEIEGKYNAVTETTSSVHCWVQIVDSRINVRCCDSSLIMISCIIHLCKLYVA